MGGQKDNDKAGAWTAAPESPHSTHAADFSSASWISEPASSLSDTLLPLSGWDSPSFGCQSFLRNPKHPVEHQEILLPFLQ